MFGWSEAIPTLSGDFPCINTLWHQQELGTAASSPLPVPLEILDWGALVCRNQLLLDSGVKPLLLGLQSPDGTRCTLGLAHPYPPASCPAGWGQQPGMFYSTVILLPGMWCLSICIHAGGSQVLMMLPVITRARKGHPQVIKVASQKVIKS